MHVLAIQSLSSTSMSLRAFLARRTLSSSPYGVSCRRAHKQTTVNQSTTSNKENAFQMTQSTLRFGPGVTKEVGKDVAEWGAKKPLVVADPALLALRPFKVVAESLTSSGVDFTVFDRVVVEPTDASFKEAIDFARRGDFDCFVAVGGGSTIDTAKAAAIYAANPDAEFLDFVCPPYGKHLTPTRPCRPLLAVPTTAGTGSETTTAAVFDFEGKNVKSAIRQRAIKPHLAIVDPLNLESMPRQVALYSGLDVLCHALESYTAKPFHQRQLPPSPKERPIYQGSNPISDVWTRASLEIIGKYFRRAVNDPGDLEARSQMLLASSYAGIGFGNAGVHLCHALSYPIACSQVKSHSISTLFLSNLQSKSYKSPDYPQEKPLIPHGLSVILTASEVFRFTFSGCPRRHLDAAGFLGADISRSREEDAGEILAEVIRGFVKDLGAPNGLSQVGFDTGDVESLVEAAMIMTIVLTLSPREQTKDDLARIFTNSMKIY